MATSFVDRRTLPDSAFDETPEYLAYSRLAIASVVLAILSPLCFAGWWFAIVPILGFVFGLLAWLHILDRPQQLAGIPLAIGGASLSAVFLVGGLSYQTMIYVAELPEGFERLSYSDLQPLEGDPDYAIPDAALAFHGKEVLLKGYMYPGDQTRGIVQFLLVRDQGDCCFGGNPKITDRVLVQLQDPNGISFSAGMTKVAGRFSVRDTGLSAMEGGVYYHIENAVVR
ncbi:MAG: hypothetical protein DWH94_09785 [Planctomycetota bacterium]|nr:MAG: hypothetical protein DWH94_09785 [Planctomycetota bacterium]